MNLLQQEVEPNQQIMDPRFPEVLCLEHQSQIMYLDTRKNTLLGNRALCDQCNNDGSIEILNGLEEWEQYKTNQEEQIKRKREELLLPLQELEMQYLEAKAQINNKIDQSVTSINYFQKSISINAHQSLDVITKNDPIYDLTKLQNIAKLLSEKPLLSSSLAQKFEKAIFQYQQYHDHLLWILQQQCHEYEDFEIKDMMRNRTNTISTDTCSYYQNYSLNLKIITPLKIWNQKHNQLAVLFDDQQIQSLKDSEKIFNTGLALDYLNFKQGATKYYDRAISLNQEDYSKALNLKGLALDHIDEIDKALKCFEYATQLNSKYSNAFINQGNTLIKLNRFNEALNCYDKAFAINPNDPDLLITRGLLQEKIQESINK